MAMLSLIFLAATALLAEVTGSHNDPSFPSCPDKLTIGGVYYDKAYTCSRCPKQLPPDCLWHDVACMYQMRGLPGSRYCLKPGKEKTEEGHKPGQVNCTYDASQYAYAGPLLNTTTAENGTDCSIQCFDFNGFKPPHDPAPPVCRGWSYNTATKSCYLYNWYKAGTAQDPQPNSLNAGVLKTAHECIAGPLGCIVGGPPIPFTFDCDLTCQTIVNNAVAACQLLVAAVKYDYGCIVNHVNTANPFCVHCIYLPVI